LRNEKMEMSSDIRFSTGVPERARRCFERMRRAALADSVVGGGEAWLTELDDAALAELVRLGEEG
jgi:hypothetical protein